jgi:5-(carboxyamino)imidazole ribonucleotide mutase
VALNAAHNAGLLAAQILGTSDQSIKKKMEEYKEGLKLKVQKQIEELEEK